jgi:hypothetical protein
MKKETLKVKINIELTIETSLSEHQLTNYIDDVINKLDETAYEEDVYGGEDVITSGFTREIAIK